MTEDERKQFSYSEWEASKPNDNTPIEPLRDILYVLGIECFLAILCLIAWLYFHS